MGSHKQNIPFPLPNYLANFITHQIPTKVETIDTGVNIKLLHIRPSDTLGKMVVRCLRPGNKKKFVKEGCTLFIAASNYIGTNDDLVPSGEYTHLSFLEKELQEIIEVFERIFETALFEYVQGAEFGYSFTNKKKGIVFKAIKEFIKMYNISADEMNFSRLVKRYQRKKNKQTPVITGLI